MSRAEAAMQAPEGDPTAYDPVDDSWEDAKTRLIASKQWRCAATAARYLYLSLSAAPRARAPRRLTLCTAAPVHRREPTQPELNNASEAMVGNIICIEGHGPGKVTEFLKNGAWGVKSGHMIDFGDPFGEGGSEPNAKEVKLKRKGNTETEWLRYIGTAGGASSGGFGAKKKAGGFAKKKSSNHGDFRRIFHPSSGFIE